MNELEKQVGNPQASNQNIGSSRKQYLVVLGTAFIAYVASFFLTAVRFYGESGHYGARFTGYECALLTLAWPREVWGLTRLIDGCINPALLLSLIFAKFHKKTPATIFGWLTAAMVICSWIFFLQPNFSPREGYFLWIASISLMLFALRKISFEAPKRPPELIQSSAYST